MNLISRRLLLMLPVTMLLAACAGERSKSLGMVNKELSPCPNSPNCVSSQSKDKRHFIEPLPYKGTREETFDALVSVVGKWPRSKIVSRREEYIRVEFTSPLFKFIDDGEFYFDDDRKLIQVRSASRTGYFDFGVNRKRIEKIRAQFLRRFEKE